MANEVLKFSRKLHLYFGVFIIPSILFFALTGALQTFGLHETNRDHPDYKPARWIVVLGQLHKHQTAIVPVRKPQAPALAADVGKAKHDVAAAPAVSSAAAPVAAVAPASIVATSRAAAPAPIRHPLPLRIFFLVVSVGLFSSTATGLFMAYRFAGNKKLITAALVVGIVVPLVLVFV